MAIQIIVYSKATGRVRRVLDPEGASDDVELLISCVGVVEGEAALVYNKLGEGNDHVHSWQHCVTQHCGLTPIDDRYVAVDSSGKVQHILHSADPRCGDKIEGHTLIQHNNADTRWCLNANNELIKEP